MGIFFDRVIRLETLGMTSPQHVSITSRRPASRCSRRLLTGDRPRLPFSGNPVYQQRTLVERTAVTWCMLLVGTMVRMWFGGWRRSGQSALALTVLACVVASWSLLTRWGIYAVSVSASAVPDEYARHQAAIFFYTVGSFQIAALGLSLWLARTTKVMARAVRSNGLRVSLLGTILWLSSNIAVAASLLYAQKHGGL